jgi:O-antigen ligase
MLANLLPNLPFSNFLLFIAALIVFIISFIKTDFALVILIFSMLLSPEVSSGVIPGRSVVIRADDIFLFIVFFGWMAKMAVNKELGFLRMSALNRPVLAYIGICVLSSALGSMRGTTNPFHSLFYLLKYFEYFLIFFMVSNNIKEKGQIRNFTYLMLFVCIIVNTYAVSTASHYGRVTAPFEGKYGEPNTLAGYLLVIMGMALGILLYSRSFKRNLVLSSFLLYSFFVFFHTGSRGGVLGLIVMLLTFLALTRRNRTILLFCLVSGVIVFLWVVPKEALRRYESAFQSGWQYQKSIEIFGRKIELDDSAALRLISLDKSLKQWSEYPVLGRGVPGGGIVSDVQYTRVLREVGIVGFLIFIWLSLALFKEGWRSFLDEGVDDFGKGLSLGFMACFAGLFAMGISAEVFIIIRIMEPFWFLAAMVAVLPELREPFPNPEADSLAIV